MKKVLTIQDVFDYLFDLVLMWMEEGRDDEWIDKAIHYVFYGF